MPFDWMAKDGKIILIEKAVRTVPYGFLGVLFSVYLSQLGLDAFLIGVVLALTVASSAIYTLVASVFADRLGRKRTLIFFALTDALASVLLFSSDSLWAPITAGILGNMTVGAGEVGPFLTLEQAILPGASNSRRRTLGFSVYNLVGYVSSSAGALLVGLPHIAPSSWHISPQDYWEHISTRSSQKRSRRKRPHPRISPSCPRPRSQL